MAENNAPGGVLYRFTAWTVVAVTLGTVVAFAAIGFVECVRWLNDLLLVSPRARIQVDHPLWLGVATVLVPTLGGVLVGVLVQRGSSLKRPLGPADVIRQTQLRSAPASTRAGLVSTIAAMVSLGCGASVGQYGPLVYLGSLLGHLATRLRLRIPDFQSIAVACGVAAAISTAFNAPIAGLVFAHEVILRHYSMQAFAPTTVAAATGYVIANVIFERPPLFLVAFDGVQFSHEFALFAVLGVLCALLAIGFMRLILAAGTLARSLPVAPVCRPAVAGLSVGLVALVLPDAMGIGQEALRFATIDGAYEQYELLWLVLAKVALTALCIGFGFAGGVFSPALLIGILSGALYWSVLSALGVANSGVAVYAITGMMALTSPVIGAPLTTILIVFELTRNYDLTIAAMVGVVFANLLAYRLFGRSLFDRQLLAQGIDLSTGRDQAQLQQALLVDQPCESYRATSPSDLISEAVEQLVQRGRAESVVIDENGVYRGIFRIQRTINTSASRVSEVIDDEGLMFDESTTVWRALEMLEGFVGEAVPVVNRSDGRLIMMISEGEVIQAYLNTVHELRREENAAV